uniref:Uncharacterized protein n=1 Tax=Arundo donax TaxID=35708 RepID=A0A0A8Z2M8_ARUDO
MTNGRRKRIIVGKIYIHLHVVMLI